MTDNNKIVKGGFYLTLVNIFSQILALVVNIVLARLLLPKHFGLIALATTYIGFITLFTNIGFGSSIIHDQDATQKQLSSIYWLNFFLAVGTFLLIFLTAPLASQFYNEPELNPLVKIASFNILLTPFFITHYKLKERDMEFKFLSLLTFISTSIASLMAVIAAYLGFGVYALVVQIIAITTIRGILVLFNTSWRPSFYLKLEEIKNMIWYSVKFKASELSLYFERNVDYLIMGRVFSTTVLGYYAFSYNIMYAPVKNISYVFSNVLFPTFSSMKENKERILTGYFKSIQLIAMVSFPAMALISYNADLIIHTVFGNKWDEAIPILRILSFAGAIQSISQLGGVIFSSIGKPEVSFYVSLGRTLLTIAAILGGFKFGILMVAYFLVFAKLLSFGLFLFVLHHFISFSWVRLFKYLSGPLTSVICLTTIHFVFAALNPAAEWIKLGSMALISLLVILIFHLKTLQNIYKQVLVKGAV